MIYSYDLVLHNFSHVPMNRACELADMIQSYLEEEYSHVQCVTVDGDDVKIIINTQTKLDDFFGHIFDNRSSLGYKDFSIYYSELPDRCDHPSYGA